MALRHELKVRQEKEPGGYDKGERERGDAERRKSDVERALRYHREHGSEQCVEDDPPVRTVEGRTKAYGCEHGAELIEPFGYGSLIRSEEGRRGYGDSGTAPRENGCRKRGAGQADKEKQARDFVADEEYLRDPLEHGPGQNFYPYNTYPDGGSC